MKADFLPGTTPSKAFPSWIWASVKADRPSDDAGVLDIRNAHPHIVEAVSEDVNIQLWHLDGRSMDMSIFVSQNDEWKAFHPCLDVTTWTRRYEVRPIRQGSIHKIGSIGLFGSATNHLQVPYRSSIYDILALEKLEVHAIGLKTSGLDIKTNRVHITGLLVVGTEPGLYRRIDLFKADVALRYFEL